jgi:dTDP-4-amino-4,6-dideoxygalactose transaminase
MSRSEVQWCEREFTAFLNAEYTIAVKPRTAGLPLAVEALELKRRPVRWIDMSLE